MPWPRHQDEQVRPRYQNEEPRPSEPRLFHVRLASCRSEVPIFGVPAALIIVHMARGP